jgi:polyhydroxyalkanoate synthase
MRSFEVGEGHRQVAGRGQWRRNALRAEFLLLDQARRAQGDMFAALGLGAVERPFRITASGRLWRLRDYGAGGRGVLLIVGSPIKRPYVWDLAPSVSTVGYCLDHGFGVHLLEWTPAAAGQTPTGLDDYVEAITARAADVLARAEGKPILLGHSLGGTLATIAAACAPRDVAGLVLLGAPLCFGEGVSSFRDALVDISAAVRDELDVAPGSLLSQLAALASPSAFVWSRLARLSACLTDPEALAIDARIERWSLDEVALPGRLVTQILDWLFREDRLCQAALPVAGRLIGPQDLVTPTLAVVDAADEIAPRATVEPFLRASPASTRILEQTAAPEVSLQHLALLVGREARARVWPEILAWAEDCANADRGPCPGRA